jgi:hypothetical protein
VKSICPKFQRVAWYYEQKDNRVVVFRLACGMWNCPVCAIANRKRWRTFLNKRLPKIADNWWLMTLTARADTRGRLESYKQLQHGIDTLIKRFRRAFGKVQYVRVYEKHPTSEALHAHFIITGLSDYVQIYRARNGREAYKATNFRKGKRGYWAVKTFTKKTAQACKIGYIADCKQLGSAAKSVKYVTEYMTKDAQDIDIRGLRHVQTTRAIGSPKNKSNKPLYVGYRLNSRDRWGAMTLYDADTRKSIPDEYWQEANVYPPLNEHVD